MKAADETETMQLAVGASGCDDMVVQKLRLLRDNGSSCVAGDLADFLEDKRMHHTPGAPHNSFGRHRSEAHGRGAKSFSWFADKLLPGR